ncbi:hypothetical protein L596_001036 [Steinernema carpocapsae]|uniref:Uncharacterized protein n=1 Tax=Steinernema carpocapsae TaxID=34508 RepID=A0A4U8UME9_STECR|nr:hypothetical protein L596_001036 [Steinernema carpocapsae]
MKHCGSAVTSDDRVTIGAECRTAPVGAVLHSTSNKVICWKFRSIAADKDSPNMELVEPQKSKIFFMFKRRQASSFKN